jgi:two-component system, chemotaxis family, protein-glutamate methylesterase/glutaminase
VEGLRAVHAMGGRIIAQDELSSVVYGMAREAVEAGLVSEILPLDRIGRRLIELVAE